MFRIQSNFRGFGGKGEGWISDEKCKNMILEAVFLQGYLKLWIIYMFSGMHIEMSCLF